MAEPAVRAMPPWRTWASTVRRMAWRDRGLVLEAIILVTAAAPLVRILGVRRLLAGLSRRRAALSRPADAVDGQRPRDIARLVAMAARHAPVSNTCLHRSLALWWLLGRRGFMTELVVGARKEHDTLAAHAWVECLGVVINDDPTAVGQYVVLSRTTRS